MSDQTPELLDAQQTADLHRAVDYYVPRGDTRTLKGTIDRALTILRDQRDQAMVGEAYAEGIGLAAVEAWEKRALKAESDLDTLTARCEALEQENQKIDILLSQASQQAMLNDRAYRVEHVRCEALTAKNDALEEDAEVDRLRIEALTAERDSWRRVAERLEGEKVEAQTRCQHLEQEMAESVKFRTLKRATDAEHRVEHLEQAVKTAIGEWSAIAAYRHDNDLDADDLDNCVAALASLLPAQEGAATEP